MQEKLQKNAEISVRISQVIDYLGISANKFSQKLGYERTQTIYDIIKGKSFPSYDFFYRLYHTEYSALINPYWLITGNGIPFFTKNDQNIIRDFYKVDYKVNPQKVTSNGNPGGNVRVSDLERQILQKEELIAALRSSDLALREANKDKETIIGYLHKEIATLTRQLNEARQRVADLSDELSNNICSECRKKRKVG